MFEQVIMIDKGKLLLKEDTEQLVSSGMLVSGSAEEVDALCEGLVVRHVRKVGRSKTAAVFAPQGDSVQAHAEGHDVDLAPMTLQKVFVALCGEE